MELFLVRHGIAVDRRLCRTDFERPLTPLGRKRTRQIAEQWHKTMGKPLDVILTSPLVRARQTAAILKSVGLSETIETFPPLAPGGDLQLWVNWNQVYDYHRVALVGHQPALGLWAEQLVWGEAKGKLIVKKAGLIGLKVSDRGSPIGSSDLFLLTPPKYFL